MAYNRSNAVWFTKMMIRYEIQSKDKGRNYHHEHDFAE